MAESIVWVDPDGNSFTLGDTTTSPRRSVLDVRSAGPADHQHWSQTLPLLPGALRVGGRDEPRIITLAVTHAVTTRGNFWTRRGDLAELFDPYRGESRLQIVDSSSNTWEIRGYAWGRPEIPLTAETGTLVQGIVVQFWAAWPYWYDSAAYDAGTNTDGVVTATVTLSGTSTVTTALVHGTRANGFVDTYPHSFTIAASGIAGATNVDIWISTISSINFNSTAGYTIDNGETVTITCPPFGHFKANSSADGRVDGYFKKDDLTPAFKIPVGGGTLSAKGGAIGNDAVVTLIYRQFKRGI